MANIFNNLSDNDLLFGYKQIVWYYENEVKNGTRGFNKNRLKPFLENKGIAISTSSNIEKASRQTIGQKRKSYLFFSQKGFDIPLILRVLRNSFAHSNVSKILIGGHYYLVIYNFFRGKKTFVGQISYAQFHDFIDALKGCRY